MAGVRAAVHIAAQLRAGAHHETPERPVAAADGEGAHSLRAEFRLAAHDPLDIERDAATAGALDFAHGGSRALSESRAAIFSRVSHTIASPGSAIAKLVT